MLVPGISTVATTIQTAIAPIFLLAGIGGILNVVVGRLARIVDRARKLEAVYASATGAEHARAVWELRLIDRRISVINAAIVLCVSSGVAICLVVAGLFVAVLADVHIGWFVAIAFILSMLLLIAGLTSFLVEVRMSLRAIHVRAELMRPRE